MAYFLLTFVTGFIMSGATLLYIAGWTRGLPNPKRARILLWFGIPVSIGMAVLVQFIGERITL